MAVDESGHDYAPGCINLRGFARFSQVLHPAGGTHFHHFAIANQEGSIVNQAEIAKRRPATGAVGPSQRQQLAGAPNQNCPRLFPLNLL
jgi:hypothetical protein